MVGFPGESDEHFEELCRFIKEIKFDKMGCFTYSAEEDTPAAEYDNQIDEEVKKRRADVLMDIQYSISEQLNKARVGNTYKVIVDSFDDGMYNGRAYFDSPEIDSGIIFKSNDKLEIGEFVNVKITGCDGYDLIGEKV
jgi:TIGR01125: MiaB-like tRNA modifying enzyme YliG, TIGR01125